MKGRFNLTNVRWPSWLRSWGMLSLEMAVNNQIPKTLNQSNQTECHVIYNKNKHKQKRWDKPVSNHTQQTRRNGSVSESVFCTSNPTLG